MNFQNKTTDRTKKNPSHACHFYRDNDCDVFE